MTTEPKPEKTTLADLARALDPILYPHLNPLMQGWPRLMQIATQVCVAFRAAGWIGPKEAAVREAAARREALQEAREDIRERRRRFAGLGCHEQYLLAMDDCFGLVNNRLSAALAETERDEEGGND